MLVSSKLAEEMAKKIVRKNNCPIFARVDRTGFREYHTFCSDKIVNECPEASILASLKLGAGFFCKHLL